MSKTLNLAKVIATCLIIGVSMQMCCSSAIPIWELLTRNEKMSYLYSTFAQLVSVHCKATAATSTVPVNQCKRNLLTYGYEKLQTFSNEQLDAYDPYQRGASELIWSTIMRDHPSSTLITTRKPLPTPPATSIIILTHQKPVKSSSSNDDESTIEMSSNANTDSQQYPQNPIFESDLDVDVDNSHKYAMDMDIAYGYDGKPDYNPTQVEVFNFPHEQEQEQEQEQDQQDTEQKKEQTFLTGPLVVRVRPDGTPVDDTHPTDDDHDASYINADVMLPPKLAPKSTPTPAPTPGPSQIVHAAAGRPTKHRKIATISALKQQYINNLALKQELQPPIAIAEPAQELQPPMERPRTRRQYPAMPNFTGYRSV